MTTTKNRYLILAAAAALTFTLASCSGGDEGTETSSDADTTTSAEAETTDEATEETTTEEAAAGGAECLVGTWEITPEAMEEQILAAYGGEGEATAEGTSTIAFDGSTYTSVGDSTVSFSVEVSGTPFEGQVITDGTLVVEYTADDAAVTFGNVVSADGTVTTVVSGTESEISLADTASALTGITQTYSCTDAELTVTTSTGGLEQVVTYTRA